MSLGHTEEKGPEVMLVHRVCGVFSFRRCGFCSQGDRCVDLCSTTYCVTVGEFGSLSFLLCKKKKDNDNISFIKLVEGLNEMMQAEASQSGRTMFSAS